MCVIYSERYCQYLEIQRDNYLKMLSFDIIHNQDSTYSEKMARHFSQMYNCHRAILNKLRDLHFYIGARSMNCCSSERYKRLDKFFRYHTTDYLQYIYDTQNVKELEFLLNE